MKKLLAIILSVLLVLCLVTGCSTKDENSDSDKNDSSSSQSSETVKPAAKLTMGTVNGTTYENEFMGIGCKLDDGWTFASEDVLKALINITIDKFDEKYQEQLESAAIVYAMQATDASTGNNININLEKLTGLNKTMTASKYVDAVMSQMSTALESAGFSNLQLQKAEVEIDGTKHAAIAISADVSGIKIYEKVVCIKCDDYIANITLATVSSDTTDELLSKFYNLEK